MRDENSSQLDKYMEDADKLARRFLVAVWHGSQEEMAAVTGYAKHQRDVTLGFVPDGDPATPETHLAAFDIDLRVVNSLELNGISTVRDLLQANVRDFKRIPNIGEKYIWQLKKLQNRLRDQLNTLVDVDLAYPPTHQPQVIIQERIVMETMDPLDALDQLTPSQLDERIATLEQEREQALQSIDARIAKFKKLRRSLFGGATRNHQARRASGANGPLKRAPGLATQVVLDALQALGSANLAELVAHTGMKPQGVAACLNNRGGSLFGRDGDRWFVLGQ